MNLAALAFFAALVLFAWIFPASRAALAFTEAEAAWLFAAPLTRPQLIRFKLLKSQVGLLLMAVLMTLLTGRLARDGHAWQHAMGWWVIFATLQLHRLGASFALTRLMDRGLSNWWRRLGVLAILGAIGTAIATWAQQAPPIPGLHELIEPRFFTGYLSALAKIDAAQWIVTPCRLVVDPWFAPDGITFLRALLPALAVIALHYLWVIHSQVAFEEASLQLTEKRAAAMAAHKAGEFRFTSRQRARRDPVFHLHSVGWPALAFVWKSWIRYGGRETFRIASLVAVFCVIGASAPLLHAPWREFAHVAVVAGIVGIFAFLFSGPQMTAQSMRRELQAVEWLKACPVPSSQIVLGQLLGPALMWAAIQWVGLLVFALGSAALPDPPEKFGVWVAVGLTSAIGILPAFNVVASLVPSSVMLLFPGWFKPGEMRGVEATGLGLLMVFAQLVFLALSLIPPALAFGGVAYVAQLLIPLPIAVFAGCIVAATTLTLEAWLGAAVLGGVFTRFDASIER